MMVTKQLSRLWSDNSFTFIVINLINYLIFLFLTIKNVTVTYLYPIPVIKLSFLVLIVIPHKLSIGTICMDCLCFELD